MGENSILNSDETFEKVAQMNEEQQTNYMLQRMVNDYLDNLKLPSTEEILKSTGGTEEPGVLTKTHIKLLQCMVKDYYKTLDKSIEETAKEKGIELKEGELSDLEQETIDTLLADYCKSIQDLVEAENAEAPATEAPATEAAPTPAETTTAAAEVPATPAPVEAAPIETITETPAAPATETITPAPTAE